MRVLFLLEQVQMNILSDNHGTIVTKSIEELGLSADKIDVLTQDRPNLVGTEKWRNLIIRGALRSRRGCP